jgi:hypothetical protein
MIAHPSVQQAYTVIYRFSDLTSDEEIETDQRAAALATEKRCSKGIASNPVLTFAKTHSNFIDMKLTYTRYSCS